MYNSMNAVHLLNGFTPLYANICLSEDYPRDLNATQLTTSELDPEDIIWIFHTLRIIQAVFVVITTRLWMRYVEPRLLPYAPKWIQSCLLFGSNSSIMQPQTDTEITALNLYARAIYTSDRLLEANQSCPRVDEITEMEAFLFHLQFSIHLKSMEKIRNEFGEFCGKLMTDNMDLHGAELDAFNKLSDWTISSSTIKFDSMEKKTEINRRFLFDES